MMKREPLSSLVSFFSLTSFLIAILLAPFFLSPTISFALEVNQSRDSLYRQQVESARKQMSSDAEVEKIAKEYEAVAVTKMLQQMYADVKIDPLFQNQATENIYKDLLLTEYGKIVAENGGLGIAKSLTKDIKRQR